jgi:hypothetical protein
VLKPFITLAGFLVSGVLLLEVATLLFCEAFFADVFTSLAARQTVVSGAGNRCGYELRESMKYVHFFPQKMPIQR